MFAPYLGLAWLCCPIIDAGQPPVALEHRQSSQAGVASIVEEFCQLQRFFIFGMRGKPLSESCNVTGCSCGFRRGAKPIEDWQDLLQPALKGRLGISEGPREFMAAVFKSLDLPLNATTEDLASFHVSRAALHAQVAAFRAQVGDFAAANPLSLKSHWPLFLIMCSNDLGFDSSVKSSFICMSLHYMDGHAQAGG